MSQAVCLLLGVLIGAAGAYAAKAEPQEHWGVVQWMTLFRGLRAKEERARRRRQRWKRLERSLPIRWRR